MSQGNKVRSETFSPQWKVDKYNLAPVIGVFFGKLRRWYTFSVSGLHPGLNCRFWNDGASSHNIPSPASYVRNTRLHICTISFVCDYTIGQEFV